MKLSDMTILLTGATGGIGCVIATALVQHGASLLLSCHRAEPLKQLEQQLLPLAKAQQSISCCVTNLLDQSELEHLQQRAEEQQVNVLINNAGIMQFGLMSQQSTQYTTAAVQLNTLAPMLLTQQLLPHLQRQPVAQIINIGSTFASIGYPGFVSYSASKAAIKGFSEALKRELADTSVQVKYLSPRATRTGLNSPAVVAMNKALKVTMDPPEVVAQMLIKVLQQPINQLAIGWPEQLFIYLNKLFPALVDRAIAKQLPVIKRYALSATQI